MKLRHQIGLILTLFAGGLPAEAGAAEPVSSNDIVVVSEAVFDVLHTIAAETESDYSTAEVHALCAAVWRDLQYTQEEMRLARMLASTRRPFRCRSTDGREFEFSRDAGLEAAREQRFLLPLSFSPRASTYYVQAFRRTRDASIFVAAARVHPEAIANMEATLLAMINEARFAAKSGNERPLRELFAQLQAGQARAAPEVQTEFVEAVRRVCDRFSEQRGTLAVLIHQSDWLKPRAK